MDEHNHATGFFSLKLFYQNRIQIKIDLIWSELYTVRHIIMTFTHANISTKQKEKKNNNKEWAIDGFSQRKSPFMKKILILLFYVSYFVLFFCLQCVRINSRGWFSFVRMKCDSQHAYCRELARAVTHNSLSCHSSLSLSLSFFAQVDTHGVFAVFT